jgi:hypothetical protein
MTIAIADNGSLCLIIPPSLFPAREPTSVLGKLRAVFNQAYAEAKGEEAVNVYLTRHQALTFARNELRSSVTRERDRAREHHLALDLNQSVAKLEQEIVHERGLQEKLAIREAHLSESISGAYQAARSAWGAKAGALLRQEQDKANAELAALEARMLVVPLGELLPAILDALDAKELLLNQAATLLPSLPLPPAPEAVEPTPAPVLPKPERVADPFASLGPVLICPSCGAERHPVAMGGNHVRLTCIACSSEATRRLAEPGATVYAPAQDVFVDWDAEARTYRTVPATPQPA